MSEHTKLQDALNEAYVRLLLYADDRTLRMWNDAVEPGMGQKEQSEAIKKVIVELRRKVILGTTIGTDEIKKIEVKPWQNSIS
jgi:hypothetical protein